MQKIAATTIAFLLFQLDTAQSAEPASDATSSTASISTDHTSIPLVQLVQIVAPILKKRFVVDPRLQGVAVVAGFDARRISYRDLQAILRVNGFAAMEIGDSISIVPDAGLRQLPMPVIDRPSTACGDDDVVTSIMSVGKLNAGALVPALRPMLPVYAQLSADAETNSLIIVDRYGNIRRIESLVRDLESRPIVEKSAEASKSLAATP